MTIRSVVVLPAPLGPSRPKTLPRGTSRERSFTATWPAKALDTPLSTRAWSFTAPPSLPEARAGARHLGARRAPLQGFSVAGDRLL